ncbi:MAG TPA: hypothetical protein VFD92_04800 [Candidatus Binatia bacterium]|nr:hypothetical protein [Candidatus Binatia bacterium]
MDIYDTVQKLYLDAIGDLDILAGDVVGPGNASWQDVAGTAAINLRSLADFLDAVRTGQSHWRGCPITGPVVFPGVRD